MIDFVEVFGRLWKHRLQALLLSLVFFAGCVLLYFRATPQYMSMSKWISVSQDPSASSLQRFSSFLGGGGISSQDDFTNYKDIIISSEFLKPLLKSKVLLEDSPDSAVLGDVLWNRLYAKADPEGKALKPDDPEVIVGMTGEMKRWINFVSRSPVYQLRITTWDPRLAQSFNAGIIERAIEYNLNERLGLSKRKRKYLETQLEAFKAALLASESRLLAFETKNFSAQSPALVMERSRLMREIEINSKLVMEFRTEHELARAEEDKEAVQISTIEKPSYSSSKTFPGKRLFLGGGLFSSLILGCLAVLMYDFMVLVVREYRARQGKGNPA